MNRQAFGFTGFGAIFAGLLAATASAQAAYDPGPVFVATDGCAPGPIHRRGRFKRNQRLQRKRGRK